MADAETPVTVPAAPAAAEAAPSAPAATTESPTTTAPAATSTEVAASSPAPAAEAPTTAPVAEPAKEAESSLLGTEAKEADADKKPEEKVEAKTDDKAEKPTEEKKPEDKKPEESKPEAEKAPEAPLPTYEAFKLPENFEADEKSMGEFTGLLGKLELAKGDHKAIQEVGQNLVDLFAAKMAEANQRMTEYYSTYWNKTKQDRIDELRKDPYFGGGGDTTKQTQVQMEMAGFLQRNIPKAELQEFRKFAVDNGIDNALPLARVLNTFKQKIEKYENESSKMLPGTKPSAAKPAVGKGILQTLYGKQ